MSCIHTIFYAEGAVDPVVHCHNTYQMVFACGGSARLTVGAREYVISGPSVIFINYLENHTFTQVDSHYRRYVVNLRPEAARSGIQDSARLLSPFTDRPPGFSHVLPVGPLTTTLRVLFDLLMEENRDGSFPAGETALLQTILRCLYRQSPERFPYREQAYTSVVQQIKQRFEDNPAPDIPLPRLAEEYHVSVSYLSHSFKEATGYSIGRYHLLCRLAAAKELLTSTNRSVTDIAEDCGFSDMSNFSRYFRRETGCSPSEFRRRERVR